MEKPTYMEKIIENSFDFKLFKRLLKYAKPYSLVLIICLILLLFITAVDVLNPFLIKVAIDDIINPTESVYAVYKSSPDFTAFKYKNQYYSTLSKRYKASDKHIRIIKHEDNYYIIPLNFDLSTGYEIVKSGDEVFLQTDKNFFKVTVTNNEFAKLIEAQRQKNLFQLAIFFFALLTIGFIFNYGQILLLNLTTQKIVYNMREDLFSQMLSLDLNYFEKNPVGRLVTRITNDLDNISEMYTSVLLTILKDAFMLISIVGIMFYIDYRLTLVCLFTFPLVIIGIVVFRKQIRKIQRKIKLQIAIINAKLSEYISGMNIIQIFGVEKKFYNDFKKSNDNHTASNLKEVHIYGIFRPSMSFVYSIGLILLLLYGTGKVLNYTIELGVLIAFTRYIKHFYQPILDFSEKFNIMQSAMASAERLFIIQETKNPILNATSPKSIKKIKGEICFKNVWFGYSKDMYVLKDISFEIKAGETVAIVGHTGSGKTTIASLISRLYDIDRGKITIDGIDITELDKKKLRSHIGIVLQDTYLFSDSVKENIRMYNKSISDKRITEAAKATNVMSFIKKHPGGLNYHLRENGSEFSTGQRQLISFARALAYNPEILILDEATSNIDTETELLIQDAMVKLSQKRTSIIIAHRLSTIVGADKIIVLNKGEICESGTHINLIKNKGLYYDLYQLQHEIEEE